MPTVTSIINLKGGVGKTTLTIALAHFLAIEHHKRVLVIDLDPQTNATVCLIPENEWKQRDETGRTLYQFFADQVKGTRRFNVDEAIVRDVSNIGGGVRGLDLLPSSLRLIKVQDRVTQLTDFENYERGPIFAMRDALGEFLPYYDHVLIDCPPSLGIITLNGLAISDSYLIPVVPDLLSVLGIPPILDRVDHFGMATRRNIRALGIIISKMRAQTLLHNEMQRRLREDFVDRRFPPVFQTIIPESTRIAEAANVLAPVHTLQQKYGTGGPYEDLSELTREYLANVAR
ncbi:MAG: Chromosome (plasmid) partitioning protein ParA [Ktedonobacterales bacterium]|nr:MAG: Chromosome (plasmid) partitioning protein ParA [Ktedonobacterales bacterium]